MLLGKPEIETQLRLGNITIEPFVPANLGSAQYDVSLGENFYRETDSYVGPGDVYNPFDEQQVRQKWQLNKAFSHEDWVERTGVPLENVGPGEKIILIRPGELILAHTQEFIGGSCNFITTMMKARSSVGRNGLEVCRCAGMGDVGYFNRWTLEIANTGKHTLPLVVGRRYAQILFFRVDPVNEGDTYDKAGKYQGSKSLEVLKASWAPEAMLPKQWNDRESRHVREAVEVEERFKNLVGEVKRAMDAGEISSEPSREQRVSFAYGNVKLHNPNITREMVERAVDLIDRLRAGGGS